MSDVEETFVRTPIYDREGRVIGTLTLSNEGEFITVFDDADYVNRLKYLFIGGWAEGVSIIPNFKY